MRRRRGRSPSMERESEEAKEEEPKDKQCGVECGPQRGGKIGSSREDDHDGRKGGQSGEGKVNEAMEGSRNECEDSRRLSASTTGRGTSACCLCAIAVGVSLAFAFAALFCVSWVIAIRNGDAIMWKGEYNWVNRLVPNFARRWLLTPGTHHFLLRPEAEFALAGNRVAFPESDVSPERLEKLRFQLLWMAPFLSGGGYCSEAITYLSALNAVLTDRRNLKISQHGDGFNMKFWNGLPETTKEMINAFASRRYMSPSSTVVICHSEPGAWYPPLFQTSECPPGGYGSHLYSIGRTMFETDRVSQGHVERLNRMHEVWVPTQFHVDTFVKSGVNKSKIRKVVQPVDTNFFDQAATKDFPLPFGERVFGEAPGESVDTIPAGTFVFLSIFKWETRKGWDVLIKAYLQEFSGRDNTILYLLTNPYHSDRGFEHKVHAFVKDQGIKKPDNGWGAVHVVDMHVPQENLPGVYKAADVFVLPSRGEGWGRPHVEAMAMSLAVIATNWSGMTEYLTDSNSYPLPIDGLVEVKEGPFKGHLWAEPSIVGLRQLMRHAYENPEEARKKGTIAREDVVKKFSLAVVGAQVVQELWRIHKVTEVRGQSSFQPMK